MITFLCRSGRFLVAALIANVATAGFIDLKWDHSDAPTRAFYRVYVRDQLGEYKAVTETPWNEARINSLEGGRTYYFSVRSVNGVGIESENSPEIRVDLPMPPFNLRVAASSDQYTPWGELIAPAALKFKAVFGSPIEEVEKVVVRIEYKKIDGTRVDFYRELKGPDFEMQVTDIGAASSLGISPLGVLKNGQAFYGLVNDGLGIRFRVHPRMPNHRLQATSSQSPVIVSNPVNLELQMDDIGMPVRRVLFISGGRQVIGEDLTPPYSLEWKNAVEGYFNVEARVYYHGLTDDWFVPSNVVGIHYSKPLSSLVVIASDLSSGKVSLRGELGNCEGFQVEKVQFFEGERVVGEDFEPPFESILQSEPGTNCLVTAKAIFLTGHVLTSDPLPVMVPSRNPDPTVSLRVPAAPGPWRVPASIDMEAVVQANGNLIRKVQFIEGGSVLGEVSSAPFYFKWLATSARETAIKARVFYGDGLTIDTAAVAVLIINSKPTASLDVPTTIDGFVAPATVVMTAVINADGNAIQKVQFLEGGTLLGEDTSAPYGFVWSGVSARSTTVSARVFYGDGGIIETAPVAVVIGNAKPTAALGIPMPPGGWVAPATVGMEVVVNSNGNPIQKVQFLEGGKPLGEDTSAPYGFVWSGVSARSTTVSARVFYGDGGMIETAPVAVVVKPGQPPSVVLEVLDGGSDFRAPAHLVLRARLESGGHAIQKVSFLSGGVSVCEVTSAPFEASWENVPAGATRIVARVAYGGGSIVDSRPVDINIAAALPSPWKTKDIGVVSRPGFAETAAGKPLSFVGSSSGVLQAGRPTDSFRFVFQPLTGNGEIEAEVSAAGTDDGSEIVGLMIRENLNDSSPYVFVGVGATPFLYRSRAGAVSSTIPTLPIKARRIGIKRMVKAGGDTILLRYFDETLPNGAPRWVNFRNVPGGLVLPRTVYVGFVVASSDQALVATGLITDPLVYQ